MNGNGRRGAGTGADPGLPPERTSLAWQRTTLAMTVVAVLTVRLALSHGPVGLLLAAAVAAGWIALLVGVLARLGRVRRTPVTGRTPPLLALLTVGLAGIGLLLVLTG